MIINNLNLLNNTYIIIDQFLRQQIAKLYTENQSFLLGDFCIYNNQLYQCIEDTSGDWDQTKWENKKITNIENSIIYYINIPESNKMESIYYKTVTEYSGEQRYIGDYAFQFCSSLQSINFPVCTTIGNGAFRNCTSLQSVNFPICTAINGYAFQSCDSLQLIDFPVCTSINGGAFQNCILLQSVNFPVCTFINYYAFSGCSKLSVIYLLASFVCSLSNSNAFIGTPIQDSSYLGYFGSIYVPLSLVNTYKTATNWTYYSDRIVGV